MSGAERLPLRDWLAIRWMGFVNGLHRCPECGRRPRRDPATPRWDESAWDDDRPGMMRVHIAQERGRLLAQRHTMPELRRMAKARGVDLSWCDGTKVGIGAELAMHGVKP